jgi:uncharacterized protein YgbK (DUF1537 family)
LRGHFFPEIGALEETLGPFDAVFVIPFFEEGGRFTIDDFHYVAQDDWLVPAAQTPFARDSVFGYASSHLPQWIAEKTAGAIPAEAVHSIAIEELRLDGPDGVQKRLLQMPSGSVCIVNAAASRDLEAFAVGLSRAESQGKRFLFRTAASWVATRLGLAPRPLLTSEDVQYASPGGGLVVVGSHVPKTTEQLERLLTQPGIRPVKLDVDAIIDASRRDAVLQATSQEVNQWLNQQRDVVLFTSRQLVTRGEVAANLEVGRQVSDALVQIVCSLENPPRYFVAKGGITSSDLATRALGVRRALVRGQILPGVPVWQLGPGAKYPGMPYVVFPGNVGDAHALVDAVRILASSGR